MAINIFRAPASKMLMVGPFVFGLTTAAYQRWRRQTEYRWATIDRMDEIPAEQFIGQGTDTIELSGVIYPTHDVAMQTGGGRTAGTYQIAKMRVAASMAIPQMVVDGRGNVHGRWVITGIDEEATEFEVHGGPMKQEFGFRMRRYPNPSVAAIAASLTGALGSSNPAGSGAGVANVPIPTPRPVR